MTNFLKNLKENSFNDFEIAEIQKYIKEVEENDTKRSLLNHLKLNQGGLSNYATIKSTKISNIIINWKQFFVDTIPLGIGAYATIPMGKIATALLTLPLIRSFVQIFQIQLDILHSNIIIVLHSTSFDNEKNYYKWIKVEKIVNKCIKSRIIETGNNQTIEEALDFLEKNRIVEFDMIKEQVRIIEKLIIK